MRDECKGKSNMKRNCRTSLAVIVALIVASTTFAQSAPQTPQERAQQAVKTRQAVFDLVLLGRAGSRHKGWERRGDAEGDDWSGKGLFRLPRSVPRRLNLTHGSGQSRVVSARARSNGGVSTMASAPLSDKFRMTC